MENTGGLVGGGRGTGGDRGGRLGSVGSKHGLRPYGVPPRGPCAVVGGYCVGGGLNVAPLPLSLILLLFLVPLVFLFCIFCLCPSLYIIYSCFCCCDLPVLLPRHLHVHCF